MHICYVLCDTQELDKLSDNTSSKQEKSSGILRFPLKNEVGDLAEYWSTLFYWKYQRNRLVKNLAGL